MKKIAFTFLLLSGVRTVFANPVSFKDGWGIMPAYGRDWAELQVNYSVTNRYSLGLSEFYREGKDSTANFGIAQYNYLVKRWNEMDSQANIYASIGLGAQHSSSNDDGLAGYGAVEADYETRRIYTLIGAETLQSTSGVNFNRMRARLGFAPYKASFESLQAWLLLQVDHMPEMERETRVTPVLRFFYNNYALEAGVSFDGDPFLATMAHF